MKKTLPFLTVLLAALLATASAQKNDISSDLRVMVETERAFARTAAEKGVRDSFLAFIAEDGLLFRPGPVNGKKFLEERPARPGLLSWEPIYADISAAGDMGYTTGPWEFRPKGPEDKPVAFGNFMTIWKKQADGTFKFELDLGISNPQPASAAHSLQYAATITTKPSTKKNGTDSNVGSARASIVELERAFSKTAAAQGATKAYLSYLTDDARILREGKSPFIGKEAARSALEAAGGKISLEPVGSDAARSLDLGYSYGSYQWKSADGKQEETGNYVHIWKRQPDGRWKLVLEVLNPIPKQAS